MFGKIRTLWPDNAEPVPGRSFHHPPRSYLFNAYGTQVFQAAHLRLNVIGFDVEMNTRWMGQCLQLNVQAFRSSFQLLILGVFRIAGRIAGRLVWIS